MNLEAEEEIILRDRRAEEIKKDKLRERLFVPFPFYSEGSKLAIIAGGLMGLFLYAIAFFGAEESIGLKFLKYLILGGFLAYGLYSQKKFLGKNYRFKKGILLGLFITAVSAITLIAMNFLAFTFFENIAFEKFQLSSDGIGSFLVVSGIVFFECLVYGMILTLIILQYLKTGKRPV